MKMVARGGICAEDIVVVNFKDDYKTGANLKVHKVFALAILGIDIIKV